MACLFFSRYLNARSLLNPETDSKYMVKTSYPYLRSGLTTVEGSSLDPILQVLVMWWEVRVRRRAKSSSCSGLSGSMSPPARRAPIVWNGIDLPIRKMVDRPVREEFGNNNMATLLFSFSDMMSGSMGKSEVTNRSFHEVGIRRWYAFSWGETSRNVHNNVFQ